MAVRRKAPARASATRRRTRRPRRRPPAKRRAPAPPELTIAFVDHRLAEAVTLYNHQQFQRCREILAPLLKPSSGRARSLYQGLSDTAAAFLHWSAGERASAMSFHGAAMRSLKKCLPYELDIDVADFVQRYSELVLWLRRHRLRYEPRLVPPIRWARPIRFVSPAGRTHGGAS